MARRDQAPYEGPSPAERLGALGLGGRSAGWVPDQPPLIDPDVAPATPPRATSERPGSGGEPPPDLGTMLRDAIAAKLPPRAGDLVSRASPGSLLTAAIGVLLVVVVAVIVVTRHHGAATGASPPYSYSGEASADPTDSPAPAGTDFGATESIVVDVGGRVRKPGLVTLPVGARVADAIDAAGGPLKPRELDRIDLAQRVTDGQLLLIGVSPSASDAAGDSASSSGTDPSTPISLSTATIDQLETLPGVGPVTAQKMIDWRTAHGGFTTVEQLQQVPGIGPAHYAEISPLVTP